MSKLRHLAFLAALSMGVALAVLVMAVPGAVAASAAPIERAATKAANLSLFMVLLNSLWPTGRSFKFTLMPISQRLVHFGP